MRATWATIRAVFLVLSMLTAVAALVLVVASFFTGDTAWSSAALMLMSVLYLPTTFGDYARIVRSPKPRLSTRQLLTRWPLLLLCLLIVALFGGLIWFAFGRVWMGILVAFGAGSPMIALLATVALMEPGPRKDRMYLACTVALFAIPLMMIVTFAVVYGTPGR
jgi:hypothetical protein